MNDVIIRGILRASKELKTRLEKRKTDIKIFQDSIYKAVLDTFLSKQTDYSEVKTIIDKSTNLLFQDWVNKDKIMDKELIIYNQLRKQALRSIPELKNLDYIIPEITDTVSPSNVIYCLDNAISGCNIIIDTCESLINTKISQEALENLKRLRTEVKVLADSLPHDKQFLIENINKAIAEYEQGHDLASALIAARVIMYVYEKIPIENGSDQRDSDPTNLKVNTLIKRKIIDKNRKDEVSSFVKASKQARNILSHNAEVFPSLEESLSLIISTVTFCKYYKALSKY